MNFHTERARDTITSDPKKIKRLEDAGIKTDAFFRKLDNGTLLAEDLRTAINALNIKDPAIINYLFFDPITEKDYLYYFDCPDANIGERYFTASELNLMITGNEDPMPELDIKRTARNYEATLYRAILDDNCNIIEEIIIYDPEM